MKVRNISAVCLMILTIAAHSYAQSGGGFDITKSVLAGGGGTSTGGSFSITGTIGQSLAGTTSSGGSFQLTSGFWGGSAAPASDVTISGRVTSPSGIRIQNAIVILIDSSGTRRFATTSSLGIYTFNMVATGQSYTLTIDSKRYRFAPKFLDVNGSLTNVDFTGLE